MSKSEIKLNDCVVCRKKGKYTVKYGKKTVHTDWYNNSYDWLGLALSLIKRMKERYHTLELLLTIRQALREDCVQGWNEQDDLVWSFCYENNDKMTKKQLYYFIRIARSNDKKHHGYVTF